MAVNARRQETEDALRLRAQRKERALKRQVDKNDPDVLEAFEALAGGPIPTTAQLRKMTNAQFLQVLEAYDVIQPMARQQTAAVGAVQQSADLPAGSPQQRAAVSGLISREAKTGLRGLVIRASQQYSTVSFLKDDKSGRSNEFIWIVEGDEHTCDPCRENAGVILTYEEWVAKGLPGVETCLGGNQCRCDLFQLSKRESK